MYPLKFKKNLVKKVWGGRKFQEILNIELPTLGNYGESWEVSCHKNGMSFVENGELKDRSFQELLEEFKEKLVGKEVYEKFNNKFPLLIKYLDINDKLSVQVHPSDEYAMRVEGELGKSETWYVIDASEDASLILGIKEGISKSEFLEKFEKKEFNSIFNIVNVKKGDFIDINPGLVHASLTGSILICETQQNSDTTYRIYDFDRVVHGQLRPLQLEKAIDVIEFNGTPKITTEKSRENLILKDCIIQKLICSEYFTIDKLLVKGKYKDEINPNFKVYSIISGKGFLKVKERDYPIKMGDTYFIPALLEVEINGEIEILKSYL